MLGQKHRLLSRGKHSPASLGTWDITSRGREESGWRLGEGSATERSWENHVGTCVPGATCRLVFEKQASEVAVHRMARRGDRWPGEARGICGDTAPTSLRQGAESYPRMERRAARVHRSLWSPLRLHPVVGSGDLIPTPCRCHRRCTHGRTGHGSGRSPQPRARWARPPNLLASLGDQPPINGVPPADGILVTESLSHSSVLHTLYRPGSFPQETPPATPPRAVAGDGRAQDGMNSESPGSLAFHFQGWIKFP